MHLFTLGTKPGLSMQAPWKAPWAALRGGCFTGKRLVFVFLFVFVLVFVFVFVLVFVCVFVFVLVYVFLFVLADGFVT